MKQQARNGAMHFAEQPMKPRLLLRDNDTKYTKEFDAILESEGVAVKKVTPVSPNLNAYAERFVQSVKQECLDYFSPSAKSTCGTSSPNTSSITTKNDPTRRWATNRWVDLRHLGNPSC